MYSEYFFNIDNYSRYSLHSYGTLHGNEFNVSISSQQISDFDNLN